MSPIPWGLTQLVSYGAQDMHLTKIVKYIKIYCCECKNYIRKNNCVVCNYTLEDYETVCFCCCSENNYKNIKCNKCRYYTCYNCSIRIKRIQILIRNRIYNKRLKYVKDLWLRTLDQIKGYPQFEIDQRYTIVGKNARTDFSDAFELKIVIGSKTGINFYGVTDNVSQEIKQIMFIRKAAGEMISKNMRICLDNYKLKKSQGFVRRCLKTIKEYPQLECVPFHEIIGRNYRREYYNKNIDKLMKEWLDIFKE